MPVLFLNGRINARLWIGNVRNGSNCDRDVASREPPGLSRLECTLLEIVSRSARGKRCLPSIADSTYGWLPSPHAPRRRNPHSAVSGMRSTSPGRKTGVRERFENSIKRRKANRPRTPPNGCASEKLTVFPSSRWNGRERGGGPLTSSTLSRNRRPFGGRSDANPEKNFARTNRGSR